MEWQDDLLNDVEGKLANHNMIQENETIEQDETNALRNMV